MRIYLLFLLLLCSCASVDKSSQKRNYQALSQWSELEELEFAVADNALFALYLFDKLEKSDSLHNWTMRLKLIDNKKVLLSIYHNGRTYTKKFRGELINDRFKARNKFNVGGPLPPLLWAFRHSSNLFQISPDNTLIIYHDHGGVAVLGIMPVFGTSVGESKFSFVPLKK